MADATKKEIATVEKRQDARDNQQAGMVKSLSDQDIQIAVISNNIVHITTDMKDIKGKIETFIEKSPNLFVSQKEFNPVRSVVYGMVGLILVAVVGALIALVIAR